MKKLKYLLILVFVVSLVYSPSFSYAKFHAIKYLEGSITIPEDNYCLGKDIDTLSDCMLIMDKFSSNTNSAKAAIKAKGTPDFSKTAPQINYRESGFAIDSTDHSTTTSFLVSNSYTFNSSTGTFNLVNPYSTVIDETETSYIGKFSCFDGSTTTNCTSLYQIFSESYENNTYIVTSTSKETGVIYEVFDSDNGLYYADDDLGESYYYRGSVKNNFVSFAGMYWRIVRRNGDGSVRLIYYGNNTSEGSNYSISVYNDKYWNPTFNGFMYNDSEFSTTPTETGTISFYNFDSSTNYYFSKKYSDNGSTFSLIDDEESNLHTASFVNNASDLLPVAEDSGDTTYYYTCLSTTTSSCPVLFRFIEMPNSTTISVQLISHNAPSYEIATKNVTNSTILNNLNSFWASQIDGKQDGSGNSYSDYISDAIYCNDRSVTSNNRGYNLYPDSYYSGRTRISTNKPIFTCPNIANNGFTILGSSIGNAKLTNPIGLITADEGIFAGLNSVDNNMLSYIINSNAEAFWTMTPSYFASAYRHADVYRINNNGKYTSVGAQTLGMGLRPVISLKASVKITGGDGTASNPYQLSL